MGNLLYYETLAFQEGLYPLELMELSLGLGNFYSFKNSYISNLNTPE